MTLDYIKAIICYEYGINEVTDYFIAYRLFVLFASMKKHKTYIIARYLNKSTSNICHVRAKAKAMVEYQGRLNEAEYIYSKL